MSFNCQLWNVYPEKSADDRRLVLVFDKTHDRLDREIRKQFGVGVKVKVSIEGVE